MNQYTITNPGCYHSMIRYLAEINNTHPFIYDKVLNIRDLYWKPDAKKAKHRGLKYKSYDIVVYFSSGDKCDFIINSQRFDYWNKDQVSHFICKRNKSLNEFEIKPTKIGKYNDSLGGGWYQKVDLYQIDDKFFAMMDCTC